MNDSAIPNSRRRDRGRCRESKKNSGRMANRTCDWARSSVVAGRYDIFRNELYFTVCGRHPDFGFVDQPPLVPLLAAATQLLGANPMAIAFAGSCSRRRTGATRGLFHKAVRREFDCRLGRRVGGRHRSSTHGANDHNYDCNVRTNRMDRVCLFSHPSDRPGRPASSSLAGLVAGIAMEAKYGIAFWLFPLGISVSLITDY
jgi:hypothetical protein